jgi:hypothetical protein
MNKRNALMALALLASASLAIFGDRTPEAEEGSVVEAAGRDHTEPTRPRPAPHAAVTKPAADQSVTILALRERLAPPPVQPDALPPSRLFNSANWDPPPPKVEPVPPPPPTAPPLPFTYIGKKLEAGQSTSVVASRCWWPSPAWSLRAPIG